MRVASALQPFRLPLFQLLSSAMLLLIGGSASAISFAPPLGSSFGPDDGSEIYCACDRNPNPSITYRVMKVAEGIDGVADSTPHQWGIYFIDDPDTLIPIFSETDVPGPDKTQAAVDFDAGTVTDLDSLQVEFNFAPTLRHFGFYLRIDDGAEPVLLYSQASLDSGPDPFGSFPSQESALLHMVVFEVDGRVLSLELVDGACTVVPEPSVAVLLGAGIALLGARRRSAGTA